MPLFKRYAKPLAVPVEGLMSKPPVTIPMHATIDEAATLMWEKRVGSVLVVDYTGKLIGIITERDILYAVTRRIVGKSVSVVDVMVRNVVTAHPRDDIGEAIEKMRQANIRHLPVMDEKGAPVGMLSIRDVLDAAILLLRILVSSENL